MFGPYHFHLGEPGWLAALVLLVPVVWLGRKHLAVLGGVRRQLAIVLRCLVIALLAVLLARPQLTLENEDVCVLAVVDRSQSVPAELGEESVSYLKEALSGSREKDRLAVIDIAETPSIVKLPSTEKSVRERNTSLKGDQSCLAKGVQMAMALAPPDCAVRILLVSDGNQTSGDLKEAARLAGANGIPIDVVPLRYSYKREVVFKRLAAPARVRKGQTVGLRFILNSTSQSKGRLRLNLNGRPVDLDPGSEGVDVPVELEPGTNVQTVSVPIHTSGMHEFEAVFIPEDSDQDQISYNNRASAMTFVIGPGHVMVVDTDGELGKRFIGMLQGAELATTYCPAVEFPTNAASLVDVDAVVLINTDSSAFSYQQQELLASYVNELGGGLIMIGGPNSFGAGGWIGSPTAAVLPVEMDPPQKKQMPKGALVLIMDHSGSMSGEKLKISKVAAMAAVRLLSSKDLAGVVVFDTVSEWLVPLGPAEDKEAIYDRIRRLGGGGGTVMSPAMMTAFEKLKSADAAIKHVILLTDGQTSEPEVCAKLGAEMGDSEITVSTVAVGPEADSQLLYHIAKSAQGRFYRVVNPSDIPEIFVKEAQVVRRALIVEESFEPQITYSLSEILRGISGGLPGLDGYVLTGSKGGLNQVILTSHQGDPIFATGQSGLGRTAVFTSSIDSRWAGKWLGWAGRQRFWEQVVRWTGRSNRSDDCEVAADVQGRDVTIQIEAFDAEGRYLSLSDISGQVIGPDGAGKAVDLDQVGPGRFRGQFQAGGSGNYLVNVRYREAGDRSEIKLSHTVVTVPFAPEFRDLQDNSALLKQVSEMTGGRVLASDPDQADLFSRQGVKFPRTQLPFNQTLFAVWLGLFLLDVAVRRIVIDLAAIRRRVAGWVLAGRGAVKQEETLARLKAARQKAQKRYTRSGQTNRRYEASDTSVRDLPTTDIASKPKTRPVPKEEPKAKRVQNEQPAHLQQLLNAKRRRRDNF